MFVLYDESEWRAQCDGVCDTSPGGHAGRDTMRRAETEIAVIGGGPAGLSAAAVASSLGARVTLIDENLSLGGQLIKQTHMFFGSKIHYCGVRGIDIARILEDLVQKQEVETMLDATVVGLYENMILGILKSDRFWELQAKRIIVAAGAREKMLAFPNNDLPGVYGAGAVQTLMNVYGVRPGRKVLMVGSGNIGLIVSYQLLQAGVEVAAVVEAVPTIGGYLVHASKIRRYGVEILVSHSIVEAIGEDSVEGAIIAKLDDNWNFIPGTERTLDVDTICLAVGLAPLSEVLHQSGCELVYMPELGGWVAVHDENMGTTKKGIYVAGDSSGIEEACTAMLEGRIAGADAAGSLRPEAKSEADRVKREAKLELDSFRAGPFGEQARSGKKKLFTSWVQ